MLNLTLSFFSQRLFFKVLAGAQDDTKQNIIIFRLQLALVTIDSLLILCFLVSIFYLWMFFRSRENFHSKGILLLFKAFMAALSLAARIMWILSQHNLISVFSNVIGEHQIIENFIYFEKTTLADVIL